MGVLLQEWKNPERVAVPRFMAKLYPLEDIEEKLPDSVHVDSFVASLVGWPSTAKENIVKDVADKKVDSSVKKAYVGTHLALRADIYGVYGAQSLLSYFKTLFATMPDGGQCLDLFDSMDIAFDSVRTSALSYGASVATRRHLFLKGWNIDAAQRSMSLRLPCTGARLFGQDLEEKLHCVFKVWKHSLSFHTHQRPKSSFAGSASRSFCRLS
ncbi:hypothetical protein NDU88_002421 [Pleurodeles waltl]|uniref:Lamina-associated polypeptide 2 alpha C-terminal domain-containing protein n=1 Tax=Pleurodeles waltl TaxID=8319 RepID=A0AAV7WPU7_PLEWA|nr:hypothetical protein NDU88_002421 [Pleurodeles waltl]